MRTLRLAGKRVCGKNAAGAFFILFIRHTLISYSHAFAAYVKTAVPIGRNNRSEHSVRVTGTALLKNKGFSE